MSAFETVTRNTVPYWNINFLHGFMRTSSFVFILINIIIFVILYYFLLQAGKIWKKKIGWSELHKILIFFEKKLVYYNIHFWNIASVILEEVVNVKQLMMLRKFIIRLLSFIMSKITVELNTNDLPCPFKESLYP